MPRLPLRAALGLLLLIAVPAGAQVPAGTVLDEIVATVEGEPILASDVAGLAEQLARGQAVTDEVWSRALDQLVAQQVLIAHAQRDTTIIVSDDAVSQQLDARVEELAAQVGGVEGLERYYGKPVDQIKADYREDIRRQLMAQQFQGQRLRDVAVTPAEVRAFFESIPEAERPEIPELVRVAHVVRKPAPDPAARERARAFTEALRDSIVAGQATIEELANRHTDDPGNVARDGSRNGGRYDRFNVRELVPEFGAVSSTMQPGQLSGVFETQFGFHVLRLIDRQGDLISFNHILIETDASTADAGAAIRTLEALRDSIVTLNVPFEAIAKRHSEDPYSAARGGYVSDPRTGERDLRAEALGPMWQATLATLGEGEVSEPREAQLLDGSTAYHIVLLQRRTPPHPLNLEMDYALLSQYALQEKRQRVLGRWVETLREGVHVDIRAPRYTPAG